MHAVCQCAPLCCIGRSPTQAKSAYQAAQVGAHLLLIGCNARSCSIAGSTWSQHSHRPTRGSFVIGVMLLPVAKNGGFRFRHKVKHDVQSGGSRWKHVEQLCRNVLCLHCCCFYWVRCITLVPDPPSPFPGLAPTGIHIHPCGGNRLGSCLRWGHEPMFLLRIRGWR